MKSLHGLVVVEIAGSVAGAYCAKMFADGGADVLVVGTGTITESQHLYLHADTRSAEFESLDLATVDVVIESAAPDPLVPAAIDGHEHLVRVQISPFGMTGVRSHWRGTDLTDYAISGHAYLYGDPEREPLRGPPDQPAVAAGLYGFVGAMAGLLARDRLGEGQTVDVSHTQVMAALHQVTLLRWQMTQDIFCRMGNRYTGQGQPNGPYRCQDGWVSIVGVTQPQVEALLAVTGLQDLLKHPDIDSVMDFQSHPALMDEPLRAWLGDQRVDEVVDLFQALRIPTAPLLNPLDLLNDPQLVARDFFRPLPSDPTRSIPGPPFSLNHHQDGHATGENQGWQPGDVDDGPLSGLKILDLARVWAGPLCARILCELGAEVVWIEAPWHRGPKQIPQSMVDATRLFPNDEPGERQWNRNTHFVKYSLGKQSVALDLQTAEGQQTLARMVPHFDVLLENFSTRVMPQFGLDEHRLQALNPDLVYLTMPGYGRSGPAENWLAYGSCVDSHAGLSSLIGYDDESPWKGGIAWPDPIAALHATSAVLSALWSSQVSGTRGVTIEGAQFESTVAAVGDQVLAAQIDGLRVPAGNRGTICLLEGIYRCRGEDEWLAVSVPDTETLRRLCDLLDIDPALANDHDSFDEALGRLTATADASELANQLQAVGVPAAKVAKAPDIMQDPHLLSQNNWVQFEQPEVGPFIANVLPIRFSKTPARPPRPAPTLGEHNRSALRTVGLDGDEIKALLDSGVLATEPPS